MLKWTVSCFIIAIIAGILGFTTDISEEAKEIARYVFVLFSVLALLCAAIGAALRRQRLDK